MIVLRDKIFSMIDKIKEKLEQKRIHEYEISSDISRDEISITGNPKNTVIYIPEDIDEYLYRLDDFLRVEARYLRTTLGQDLKNRVKTISINGTLTLSQYMKLVEYIIEETDFCRIIED